MTLEDLIDVHIARAFRRLAAENSRKSINILSTDELWAKAEEEGKISGTQAWEKDKTFFRIAVWLLGIAGFLVIIGVVYLCAIGKNPSDGLIAIGSAAIGGLVGIFTTTK